MAAKFELPSWLLDRCVKTKDEIENQTVPVTVLPAEDADKSESKQQKDDVPAGEQADFIYKIPAATYAKLKDTTAAAFISGTQPDVLDQPFGILLRTSYFAQGLDMVVEFLAKEFGASTCSVDADDLYELVRSFESPSKGLLKQDGASDEEQLALGKNLRAPYEATHKYFGNSDNAKKAVRALLGAPQQKWDRRANADGAVPDSDPAQATDDAEKKTDEKKETTAESVVADDSKDDSANKNKVDCPANLDVEKTKAEESETELSEDDVVVVSDSAAAKDAPEPATESKADDAKKTEDSDKDTADSTKEPAKDADEGLPDGMQPIFLHLRNVNKLFSQAGCSDATVLQTLHDRIAVYRRQKHRIVLFVSAAMKEKPIEYSYYPEWTTLLPQSINAGPSTTVTIKSPPGISKTCKEPTISKLRRSVNIDAIQRKLSYQLQHSNPILLQSSELWKVLGEHKELTYLGEFLLADTILDQVARFIAGRTLFKSELEADDIVVMLKNLKDAAEKARDGNTEDEVGDEDSDETEKKEDEEEDKETALEKLLKTVRENCDEYEQGLLGSVVDPDKLKAGYDDVVIDNATKAAMKQLITLTKFRPPKGKTSLLEQVRITGALLYGPPGTGKTHLARAIAKESGANMLSLDAAALESKWVGETESNIHAAFTLAVKLYPCVLFIDEVDGIFKRRESNDCHWRRTSLNQFLGELDGLGSNDKAPFVVVATNRPSDLDDAFLRRLPHKVLFKLPNLEQRRKILGGFLKDENLSPEISLDELAQLTEGFSGSDIRSLCGQATLAWSLEQAEKQAALEEQKAADEKKAAEKQKEAQKDQDENTAEKEGQAEKKEEAKEGEKTAENQSEKKEESKGGEEVEKKGESKEGEKADEDQSDKKKDEAEEEDPSANLVLSFEHLERALQNTHPTVTKASLRVFDDFARQFNPETRAASSSGGRLSALRRLQKA